MNTAIQKAEERLNFVTQDKDFLRNYHRRQMELSEITTMHNTAIEKGMAEGRNEEKISIARSALAEGSSIGFVKKITGLDEETIGALQNGR